QLVAGFGKWATDRSSDKLAACRTFWNSLLSRLGRGTIARIAEQRVLFLRFSGWLSLLLFDGQPFDDRLLPFRLIRPFKLEIKSPQQDVRLDVIGQDFDDLLEQFNGLFRLSLRL